MIASATFWIACAALVVAVLALHLWAKVTLKVATQRMTMRVIAREEARDAIANFQAGRARRQTLDPAIARVPVMTLAEFDADNAPTVTSIRDAKDAA